MRLDFNVCHVVGFQYMICCWVSLYAMLLDIDLPLKRSAAKLWHNQLSARMHCAVRQLDVKLVYCTASFINYESKWISIEYVQYLFLYRSWSLGLLLR